MAQLVFIDGKNMGNAMVLQNTTTLGRLPENGIPIPHSSISERHATIVQGEGGWKILRATPEARIAVNGKEVSEQFIKHGDVLTLGQMSLVFNDEGIPFPAHLPGPLLDEDPSRFVYRRRHVEAPEEAVTTIRKGKRAAEFLELLYKVGSDLNASTRLSDLTDRLLSHLVDSFKADRVFLLLQDPRGQLQVRDERINEKSKKA